MAGINKFIIILGFILIFSKISIASIITCSGMVADDGSTDNTAAFNACTAAAGSEAEKEVLIPAGDYYGFGVDLADADVIIPAGITIRGATGAKLLATLQMSDNSKIINIDFVGTRSFYILTPKTVLVTGGWIQNCTFGISTSASISIRYGHDFIIDNNTFNNSNGGASNIEFLGGKGNIITNNDINEGFTCIILKYYDGGTESPGNGGGPGTQFWNNIIMGNTCDSAYEESLTLDLNPTNFTMGFKEYDTIASVSTPQVTLSSGGWGGDDDPDYVGFDMVFMSGALIGQTREITVQADAVFTLDSAITGAAPGDTIAILATYKNNKIAYNNITNARFTDAGILLYGPAFQNHIWGNTLSNSTISIISIDNGAEPDTLGEGLGNVTDTCTRAPAGYNYIHDNVMTSSDYAKISYASWGSCAYSIFKTYGNAFVDNTVNPTGLMNWQETSYYESGTDPEITGVFTGSTRIDYGDVSGTIDFTTPTCEWAGLGCFDTIEIGAVPDLDSTCSGDLVCGAYGYRTSGIISIVLRQFFLD